MVSLEVDTLAEVWGIADGLESGGTHTSRTIMLADFRAVLAAVPAEAPYEDYRSAVIEDNVIGKSSLNSRQRSFRYLRELYLLSLDQLLFRAMRDLWDLDTAGQPLVAILSALAHDPALRSTSNAVLPIGTRSSVTSHDLEDAVQKHFNHSYSDSIANKIGRNAASSWTQSGHLEGRVKKIRMKALATPSAIAYALLLGHLSGQRGQGLFDTLWTKTLDVDSAEMNGLAAAASARGWIEYKRFGDVVEVGFKWLLRDLEEVR